MVKIDCIPYVEGRIEEESKRAIIKRPYKIRPKHLIPFKGIKDYDMQASIFMGNFAINYALPRPKFSPSEKNAFFTIDAKFKSRSNVLLAYNILLLPISLPISGLIKILKKN